MREAVKVAEFCRKGQGDLQHWSAMSSSAWMDGTLPYTNRFSKLGGAVACARMGAV